MTVPGWDDPDRRDAALERVESRVHAAVPLSPYERRVLRCYSHGLRSGEAAEALGVGIETVKTQIASAKRKLAAKTREQACCEAIRQGLIP